MALTEVRRLEIEARITSLEKIEASLSAQLESEADVGIESYKFETAEGSQSVTRKSVSKVLDELEKVQRRIDYWKRKLAGNGIYSLTYRRYDT